MAKSALDRALTDREMAVLRRLTSVDKPGADAIRESLDFLRVDSECGCGCESFGLRDTRFRQQEHRLEEWIGARSKDGVTSLALFVGPEGRLIELDVVMPNQGRLPDPDDLDILP